MAENNVDAALDRLADMGRAALMRDVVEPVCSAMILQAGELLASRPGAKEFFAGYWSMARAIGLAFDDPSMAARCAAIFSAAAPAACAGWARTDWADGRLRLSLVELKELVEAASSAGDRNRGAYSVELVDAMVARPSGGSQPSMRAAVAVDPPLEPKALGALAGELRSSFVWPKDPVLDDMLDRLAAEAQDRGHLGAPMWAAALGQIKAARMGSPGQGLPCAFAMKLACLAVRAPGGMGLGAEQWRLWMDHLVDAAGAARLEAAERAGGASKRLSGVGGRMRDSWVMVLGSSLERLAGELALGILERAMEPSGGAAAICAAELLREVFWGRGAEMGTEEQSSERRSMAQALCARVCRSGAAACLPVEAAKALFAMARCARPAPPRTWSSAVDPWTMAWLVESSGEAVCGSQWRQLAAWARAEALGAGRGTEWARALASAEWPLAPGAESMRGAVSAKDLARALGPSDELGRALVAVLDKAGVPDGEALGRLQDLLGSLSDLGASDDACAMASRAMGQALAVLERSSLEGAMGAVAAGKTGARL